MISRVYRVEIHADGKCLVDDARYYKGFDTRFKDAPFVAAVVSEGEVEFFALDDDGPAVEELKRFCLDEAEWCCLTEVKAVYKRI
jgi:hypothetical protein